MKEKLKAIALLSGGLDSTLATRLVMDQGIEVIALNFHTGFCLTDHRRALKREGEDSRRYRNEALRVGAELGIQVELMDISQEYLEVVTNPRYGYGSKINPCIDCRIMMLRKAKAYMEKVGAKFVVTGEVVGQRPMTQHKGTLRLIEKQSGLQGLILRPLSAKILPPTIPEQEGWVDREKLFDFSGRTRKGQIQLAQALGVQEFPQPAGGCCFLTDEHYARKLWDLFVHRKPGSITTEDLILLKVGRHFRLSDRVKVIVGRDEAENKFLERYRQGRWVFLVEGFEGPLALAEGEPSSEEITLVAAITARYSDGRNEPEVTVHYKKGDRTGILHIEPLAAHVLEQWRI